MFPDGADCSGFNTRGTGSRTYDGRFEFDVLNNATSLLVVSITSSAKVRVLLEPNKITTFKTMGTTAASSTMYWNNATTISQFRGFGQLNFHDLRGFNMTNLLDLDLSYMTSFENDSGLTLSGLKELRSLNLEGVKNGDASVNKSGFALNLESSLKLKSINIKNSDVGSLILPGNSGTVSGGVLDTLDLTNSRLNAITVSNQQFLTRLDFTNCSKLTRVNIANMNALETLIFTNTGALNEVNIISCPKLKSIICTGQSGL